MSTAKAKTKKTPISSGLDERMKRELAAHDRWVAACEKKRKSNKPKSPK